MALVMPAREVGPADYWEERAQRFGGAGAGLAAVCSYGMPWFYNRYIDLTQRLALAPWLGKADGMSVLDVGCGVGRWSRRLARAGARVTGVDLAPSMVAEARQRAMRDGLASQCRFLVADVATLDIGECFDRILGVTVLQHILSAKTCERAIERLAAHLAPRGLIILLEVAPSRRVFRCDSAVFVARAATDYLAAFEQAGLRCIACRGVDPAPFKTRFLPWYSRLPRPLALSSLALVTALSLPLDAFLGGWLESFSWHKVFVLARAEDIRLSTQ